MDEQDIDGVPQERPILDLEQRPKPRLKVGPLMPLGMEAKLVASREELRVVRLWQELRNLQRQEELEKIRKFQQ